MQPIYNLKNVHQKVIGVGMNTNITYSRERFLEKYKITSPFIVYAGRKDEGKNINTLIRYFARYKERMNNDMQLVLIGGGKVKIPDAVKKDVHDLGFVDIQDKYDITASATLMCQPSKNESFSIVIMESCCAIAQFLSTKPASDTAFRPGQQWRPVFWLLSGV